MKFINKIVTFATLSGLLLATTAHASTASNGNISFIYAMANGAILFNTSGTRSGTIPSCQGAGVPQRFAIDASTTAGQAAASALLTAYSLGKQIYVQGSGTCTIWGDTETITYFNIID